MVSSTQDYSIFKKHPSNRSIDVLNLKKITNSIKMKNMMEIRPITVNKNMEVIDGQHRLEACKSLNIPVFYVISEDSQDIDIVLLNNAQKSWSMEDYINFYAGKGVKFYVDLLSLSKKLNILCRDLIVYLGLSNGEAYKKIKSGTYNKDVIGKEKEIIDKLNYVNDIVTLIKEKKFGDRTFLRTLSFSRAIISLFSFENFNPECFVKKLEFSVNRLHHCRTKLEYEEMFVSIYNYRNPHPIETVKLKEEIPVLELQMSS